MGRKIVWTNEAYELLEGILRYWEKRNGSKTYALKLDKLFQECLRQIAKYPEAGRSTGHNHVHFRIVRDYYIYYTFTEIEIKVLSICDMRRDPDYIKSLIK